MLYLLLFKEDVILFKKHVPFLICICLLLILIFFSSNPLTEDNHINAFPNLPAPIGEEDILITSAGQSAEGAILQSIAGSLHLKTDYRPRALGTDLYDYQSVVIVLGYSASGLIYTDRSFQDELTRIKELVIEADKSNLPIILVNLAGAHREDNKTMVLFEQMVAHADYYIGLNNKKHMKFYLEKLDNYNVPATVVSNLNDIHTPFNSVFR